MLGEVIQGGIFECGGICPGVVDFVRFKKKAILLYIMEPTADANSTREADKQPRRPLRIKSERVEEPEQISGS